MTTYLVLSKIELDKVCRTCLSQSNEMVYLYTNCNENNCLVEKLMNCTFVQYSENDGLPKQICSNCVSELGKAYVFAQTCERTDQILRTYCKINMKNKDETNQIQSESDNIKNNQSESAENILLVLNSNEETAPIKSDNETEGNEEIIEIKEENFVDDETSVEEETSVEVPTEIKENGCKTKTEPPFECKRCLETFPLYYSLIEHQKGAKHKLMKYPRRTCSICNKSFSYKFYRTHMRTHNVTEQFCCEFCGKRFAYDSNLRRHMRIHTGQKPYKCDICQKCFNQTTKLHDHRRTHTGERAFVCDICGKTFIKSNGYYMHMSKHKKEKTAENVENNETGTRKRKIRTSNAKEQIPTHCELCDLSFTSEKGLKQHQIIHSETQVKCSECGKIFANIERLKKHEIVHSDIKQFKCNVCDKEFATNACLKTHELRHLDKRFSCNICGKAFIQSSHLRYHLRIHSGEKPYKCCYCDKSFSLNGTLTVHMRIHTGETPFLCSVCNKGFYDSGSMKKHLRTAHIETV